VQREEDKGREGGRACGWGEKTSGKSSTLYKTYAERFVRRGGRKNLDRKKEREDRIFAQKEKSVPGKIGSNWPKWGATKTTGSEMEGNRPPMRKKALLRALERESQKRRVRCHLETEGGRGGKMEGGKNLLQKRGVFVPLKELVLGVAQQMKTFWGEEIKKIRKKGEKVPRGIRTFIKSISRGGRGKKGTDRKRKGPCEKVQKGGKLGDGKGGQKGGGFPKQSLSRKPKKKEGGEICKNRNLRSHQS